MTTTPEEDQFSLCWNNFNANLSAGFHESLCRGDLVDVTLAAEGQMVKAHRLVLSVCSPYFQKMFTSMPANQHAFVVLKDVSHTALKDLITFMYCGEVNVKHDALPTFITTAEALQIKGLTDPLEPTASPSGGGVGGLGIVAPAATTTTAPIKITTAGGRTQQLLVTSTPTNVVTIPQPVRPAAFTTARSSRAAVKSIVTESEDSADEKLVLLKRNAPRQTASAAKRIKVATAAAQRQAAPKVVSVKSDHQVLINLPMETTSPTKTTSGFTELEQDQEQEESTTTQQVTQAADEETYEEEDESYADIKYDEPSSYFTETEDTKANIGASTTTGGNNTTEFLNTSADGTTTGEGDAQERAVFSRTVRGKEQVLYDGQAFNFDKKQEMANGTVKRVWRCNQWWNSKCRARIYTIRDTVFPLKIDHTHAPTVQRKKRVYVKKNNVLEDFKM